MGYIVFTTLGDKLNHVSMVSNHPPFGVNHSGSILASGHKTCVCIFIYIYIHIHVIHTIYIYIHVDLYTCVYIHIHVYIYI